MRAGLRGEEAQFFVDKFCEIGTRIYNMPKTYDQEGCGDGAVAYLHYFKGGCDWYITEKDAAADGQHQAFGWADLGHGGELGYISIVELIANGVELDLYFSPATLGEIFARKKIKEERTGNMHDKRISDEEANDGNLTLAEVASAAEKILSDHSEAEDYDAGFDAGEFSGPAHDKMAEEEISALAERNGFTLEQVLGELNQRANVETAAGGFDEK